MPAAYSYEHFAVFIDPLAFQKVQIEIVQILVRWPLEIPAQFITNPIQIERSHLRSRDLQSVLDSQMPTHKGCMVAAVPVHLPPFHIVPNSISS